MTMETKLCKQCNTKKPFSEFSKDSHTKTGIRSNCKLCCKAQHQKWKQKDINNAREKWRKASVKYHSKPNMDFRKKLSKYGLTEEQFRELEEEHKGLCGICLNKVELVIDHCHKTSMVRGLLCSTCNSGLGMFKDNPETMKAAIVYLEEKGRVGKRSIP